MGCRSWEWNKVIVLKLSSLCEIRVAWTRVVIVERLKRQISDLKCQCFVGNRKGEVDNNSPMFYFKNHKDGNAISWVGNIWGRGHLRERESKFFHLDKLILEYLLDTIEWMLTRQLNMNLVLRAEFGARDIY